MFDLADAGALGFDADRLGRIAPFLAKTYIDNGRLPNAQLLVARDGQPVHYTRLGVMGDDQRELRDVAEVNLEIARDSELTLLFDPGHALDERIVAEQFVV